MKCRVTRHEYMSIFGDVAKPPYKIISNKKDRGLSVFFDENIYVKPDVEIYKYLADLLKFYKYDQYDIIIVENIQNSINSMLDILYSNGEITNDENIFGVDALKFSGCDPYLFETILA